VKVVEVAALTFFGDAKTSPFSYFFCGDYIALLRSFLSVNRVWKKVRYRLRYLLILVKMVEVAALTFFGAAKTSPFS
jgi:hypothetical protein